MRLHSIIVSTLLSQSVQQHRHQLTLATPALQSANNWLMYSTSHHLPPSRLIHNMWVLTRPLARSSKSTLTSERRNSAQLYFGCLHRSATFSHRSCKAIYIVRASWLPWSYSTKLILPAIFWKFLGSLWLWTLCTMQVYTDYLTDVVYSRLISHSWLVVISALKRHCFTV